MKRFRFPLQPVAVLRAHYEMRARETFAAAIKDYDRTLEELAIVRSRVAQFEATLTAGRGKLFSAAAEAQAIAAYRQERAAEARSEAAMTAAGLVMQQRRIEYLDSHRDVEVVKRLEQKVRAAHRFECNREEQAEFDDIAGARGRNRSTLFSI